MTDKELLEYAAKAAGIELDWDIPPNSNSPWSITGEGDERGSAAEWNPLTDDGDALRLAVKLNLTVKIDLHEIEVFDTDGCLVSVPLEKQDDPYAATRRAIVRAAAAIGEKK